MRFPGGRLAFVAAVAVIPALGSSAYQSPHYASCREFLGEYASHYAGKAPDGWVTPEQLAPGDWVILDGHGLVRYAGPGDGTMIRVRMIGRDADSSVQAEPGSRIARLGTSAARELVALRTQRLVPGAANMDLFFLSQVLTSLPGDASRPRAIRAALEEIWKRVSAESPYWRDRPLDELRMKLNRGFDGRHGISLAGLESEESLGTLRRFIQAVYDETGVNLVQMGILEAGLDHWNHDGRLALLRGLGGSVPLAHERSARAVAPRAPSLLVGTALDSIPIDILYDIVMEQWRRSERELDARGRTTSWLGEYLPGSAGEGHEPSAAVLKFKESGALADAEPILTHHSTSPTVAALRERLAGAGNDLLFVPVPGSDGTNPAPAALAAWLRDQIGSGAVSASLRLEGRGFPQKAQPSLWHRITNLQRRRYEVDPEVRGKVVVLVDDVLTSGVSTQLLKLRLLEAGAKAVYVFGLAKTRRPAEPVSPVSLLAIVPPAAPPVAAPAAEATAPFTEPMPSELTDRATSVSWFQAWLERGEPFPWQRGQSHSPESVRARRIFCAHMAQWLLARLESGMPLGWVGKERSGTNTERTAQRVLERAFAEGDLAFLAALPERIFRMLTSAGKLPASRTKPFEQALREEDGEIAEAVTRLYAARDDANFATLRESPYGRMVWAAARARLASTPSFRNQLGRGSPILAWLETSP